MGDRVQWVTISGAGRNALDFHIAYYLGALATVDPAGFFHIISKDTGFDPLIRHLRSRKISISRSAAIEEMPCCKQAVQPLASKTAAASSSTEELLKAAVDDLIKRKDSKPGTVKTLRSTIHAKCGKNRPESEIDAVWNALIKRGHVKINGEKVSYALPSSGA